MDTLMLVHNMREAKLFLDTLDKNAEFTFQAFEESKLFATKLAPKIFHGTLECLQDVLIERNLLGHGIFVMPNEGDLKGRRESNVIRVRAQWVDLDGAPIDQIYATPLQPHIVVESSPARWHAYWKVNHCPLDDFKNRQQALAKRFGGDILVCDLPRVMRVPGFFHWKAEPFLTRLLTPTAQGVTS